MAFDRKEYMELGARVGAPTLVDGGRRVLGAWEDDLALLAPLGFGAAKRVELSGLLDAIEGRYREFGGAESGMIEAGMAVGDNVVLGKAWIRHLQAAALNACDGEPLADAFTAEPAVGSSVKKLIRALTTYTGLAESHAAKLAPFGVGADFLTEGRKILGDLQVRREAQGKSLASMPERAAELQLVKGQAYALVKQLSRAARVALPTEQARAYTPTRLFTSPARKPKATDGAAG